MPKKLTLIRVKLNKNADPDKNSYYGYGISFDTRGTSSMPNGRFGEIVIIFSADMGASVYVDNKRGYLNSW